LIDHNERVRQIGVFGHRMALKSQEHRSHPESDAAENILFRHALVRRNGCEYRIQRSNPKGMMFRNGNALRTGLTGLKDDMAANLVHLPVLPAAAEVLHQLLTAQIARQLHATASTSSRTRRKRIESGGAESK